MEKLLYKKHLASYLDSLIQDIEKLKEINLSDFQTLAIDCKLIDIFYFDTCINNLKKSGPLPWLVSIK